MRIAYFITGLGLGGAEIVTIGVANEMVCRGHTVKFVYLAGENAHLAIIDPAIDVVGLNMDKTPLGLVMALRKAWGMLKRFKPDVVHANMFHANIFVRILRLFMNIPHLICSEHTKNIEGELRLLTYRWTNLLSDVNTNVSQEAVDFFIKVKAFKIENSFTMYNGIDVMKFPRDELARNRIRAKYNISESEFLFINLGRLTEAKNHENLLQAFVKVKQGRLLILGMGDLYDTLSTKIGGLGLDGRAILAGSQSNIGDYYSAADCFVLSSTWEGLPMVILEAMSASLPIITTDVGGARETIGTSHWIVPIKDSEILAERMKEIMQLPPEDRNELGGKNREKVLRFDLRVICDKWEQTYCMS